MQVTRSGNLAQGGSTKPAENLQYLHTDHLGSVAVVTDQDGSVTERLAYDPWGKRRFPNGTADTNDTIVGLTIDRGFTMHEHLDEMGLIHMNGRIFDPLIGRFMSADPFIQAPENLQSHNRFAYVMNNPLNLTDPSGYFSLKKLFRAVVAIVVAIVAPQILATYGFTGFASSVITGFVSGAIQTGTLKGAVISAFTAGLFHAAGFAGGAGEIGANSAERYLAHAAAGCVSSVAGGGKCGSGAVSAVFGKYTTNWANDTFGKELSFSRGFAAAIAGGVGSVIGGGKFENGAVTAAFGYLFNEMSRTGGRSYADPSTPAQLTVVIDHEGVTHAGFHLKDDAGQLIYDPAGSFVKAKDGTSGVIEGKNADLGKYVRHTYAQGGAVTVLTVNITTSDAAAIRNYLEFNSGNAPLFCAKLVSDALSNVSNPNLHSVRSIFPVRLGKNLQELMNTRR